MCSRWVSALVIGVISLFFAARLAVRFGARQVLMVGLVFLGAGMLLLSRTPVNGEYATQILPAFMILSVGMGLALPTMVMLAMSGAGASDAGLASGLTNTAQQAGAALGLAALVTLATSRSDALLDQGASTASALRDGYSAAFLAAAGLVSLALVVTLAVLRSGPSDPAPESAPDPAPAPREAPAVR